MMAERCADEASIDRGRDAWATHISRNEVKIYPLYDEEFSVTVNLDDFETALRGWKEFLI